MGDIVSTGEVSVWHRWDPTQSQTELRPTMDAIFDPVNGYVNEANQLTFKVLFEVSGTTIYIKKTPWS